MKKNLLAFIMIATGTAFQACNNGDTPKDKVEVAEKINESEESVKQVPDKTADFMVKAASGGLMEVEMGKMAQEKGLNPRVKEFGAMLTRDHAQANTEMKSIANVKGVVLPSAPGEDHREHVNDLQKKSGAEFDQAYMRLMIDDHKKDISEFEDASKFDDAELKEFVNKTLPVLRTHLDSAQAIYDAVKK